MYTANGDYMGLKCKISPHNFKDLTANAALAQDPINRKTKRSSLQCPVETLETVHRLLFRQ